jgi:hypothetical protein
MPGDLVELTRRLVGLADAQGTRLRALGGLGIELRTPAADAVLRRGYGDVDLVAPKKARRQIEDVMAAAGLRGEREFNALQGARRQIWWTPDGSSHVDVFLGEFRMCHRLDLDGRLDVDHPALPAADLLLTKLQVVELNAKDVTDVAALLTTHTIGDGDAEGTIDRGRILSVLSADWGFYTTATDNLDRLPALVSGLDAELGRQVAAAAQELRQAADEAPKSRAFALRAKVGRRKRWYDLPDESIT